MIWDPVRIDGRRVGKPLHVDREPIPGEILYVGSTRCRLRRVVHSQVVSLGVQAGTTMLSVVEIGPDNDPQEPIRFDPI